MAKFITNLQHYQKRYNVKELRIELRRWRRRHLLTPPEKLQRRYDAKLFDLIGDPNRDLYWDLYKLSPKQAKQKGLI